jgi:hypothetical protein
MKERVSRCAPIALLAIALVAVLAAPAAADERVARDGARDEVRGEDGFAAVQATCRACGLVQKSCYGNCFGLEDKSGMRECLTGCDNAALTCSCDEAVTLRSEDLVPFDWPSLTKAACHPITSCQPDYPSCASWSGYSDCDAPFCGFGPQCGDDCPEFGPCPGEAMKQRRERFRVCFNALGQSCTEWQRTMINLGCGCE